MHTFANKTPPREIPVRKDPNQDKPEEAPEIPDTDPDEDNPLNPKEDTKQVH